MHRDRRLFLIYGLLLLVALGFRLFIAIRIPTDEPDDGRVYAQIAKNVVEQHVYSHESEPPYVPSLIRLPGYPLFIAAVYSVAGHGNNSAVRVVQAVIDTLTCLLIALVAFQWMPDETRKHTAAVAALALAALCPFTAIYVGTILTEVPTNFLAVAMVLLATLAFKSSTVKRTLMFWFAAGLAAGCAVFFRPDSGLFAAAIGLTIVLSALPRSDGSSPNTLIGRIFKAVPQGAVFSLAFCLVLTPWAIRNYRVFHLFQPLSPAHGEMPGEFVPRGYLLWVRTWLDDSRYIGPVIWSLDSSRISIDRYPASAFASVEERNRVVALLEKYNHPVDSETQQPPDSVATAQGSPTPTPAPAASPAASPDEQSANEENDEEDSGDESDDQSDETTATDENQDVEMTPEIDAAFAQLGKERVARAPFRYYVVLPLYRARTLWFDTHSQYYPFEGDLLPLSDLDHTIHQHIWLPLFAALTVLYSLVGIIGGWFLFWSRASFSRRWVLLAALLIFIRLGFFASLENPEPRYTVEFFPFLTILGGIALTWMTIELRRKFSVTK